MSKQSNVGANAAAFLAGLIFAIGLVLGGMTQPAKVIGFLDIFGGAWDPSLAFVMGGAILVHAPIYALVVRRRSQPLLQARFQIPKRNELTLPLIAGSALFGAGWGLGGFCPGPGIVSLASLGPEALTFVGAMTLGMVTHHLLTRTNAKAKAPSPTTPRTSRADA